MTALRSRTVRPRGGRWLAAGVLAIAGAAAAFAAGTDAQRQKAALCEGCHGSEGRSTAADTPSLAGQPKQFVTTQLVMFREGNRKNAIMNPIAAPLSNADISELGSYFSAQRAEPAGKPLAAGAAAAARGLAESLGCVTCHGAELKGQQHIPRLAGQQPEYIVKQMKAFRSRERTNDAGNMTSVSKNLTDEDIANLANYIGSLF